MNLERAVEILNREEHEGKTTWRIEHDGDGSHWAAVAEEDSVIPDGIAVFTLSEFEAIAVAETYERDAGRDTPATREFMRSLEAWAAEAGTDKCHDNGTLDIVIKASVGEFRALLAEWGRNA